MKKLLTLFTALFFALSMMATDVLSINFTQGQGDWIINDVNLGGLNYVWSYSTQYGMKASGYAGGEHETESWLISPAFDLSEAISYATLAFSHARKFGDTNQLHVMARRNSYANWDELSVSAWPDGSNWDFVDATADLSAYIGSSSVQVAFIYTSSSTGAPTWEIKTVNVSSDSQTPIYYLVGSMTNWNPAAGYQFAENPTVSGEYTLDITLHAGDELKVVQTIDGTITTWYPDGNNNNYYVSEMGNYTVHFYPDGGMEDAYYGYYYPEKKTYPRYNVTEAINAGLQNNTEIEVRGVVTGMEIKGTNFATYGSVIFNLADVHGAEGEFKLYNCYSINESHFTATDPAYDAESTAIMNPTSVTDANGNTVHVGDTIVAFGKYLFYNSSVHELNTGCYLIDISSQSAPEDAINLEYEYVEAYYDQINGVWTIYAFNKDNNGSIVYPYLSFSIDAKSATALAGTYSVNFAELYDSNLIEATQISNLEISFDSQNYYRYQFSFTGNDNNHYVVDIIAYTDAYDESGNQIQLNEDKTKYYLVGSMNGWNATEDYQFEANPNTLGEYMLNFNFTEGDQFKVVGILEGTSTWYPDGGDEYNYVVTEEYAGEHTIYFRPEGNEAWESFHTGGFFYIFVPQDIYVNINSNLTYVDNTSTEGWWEMFYQDDNIKVILSNTSSPQAPGTYTVSELDDDYSYIQYADGTTIHFVDGSVTLSIDQNTGDVTVAGTLTGDDGNHYHINLMYAIPVAQKEVTVIASYAEFDDTYWTSNGLFQVVGYGNDSIGVSLAIWSTTKPGNYTEDDLYFNWSYIYINNTAISIYDANINVTEHEDGSYTITADLLCNNNTLYHFTMTMSVYCLVGSMNNWTPLKAYQFEVNPNNSAEYMLNVTLAENDSLKVVCSQNNEILYWYPDGLDNNYVVAANYAGEKTIYFRPNGYTEWESFHEGGYFYMEENFVPQDIYITITSGVVYTDNTSSYGWWILSAQKDDYTIELSNYYSTQVAGTYTDDEIDLNYSNISYTDGTKITFVSGSFTVTVDANSGNITLSGTLIGNDGNYYHIYMLYIAPIAQNEETLVIPNAAFYDEYWESEGVFQVYGYANDTLGVALGVFSESRAGSYTKDNLYADWSYIYLNQQSILVYEASITIVENEDGSYTVTADLLCENNTLYHVTMTVPAPVETAIDNAAVDAKAVKLIRDGQFFIIKNGVHYNAQGAVVR